LLQKQSSQHLWSGPANQKIRHETITVNGPHTHI
jgi:hypothetical protein